MPGPSVQGVTRGKTPSGTRRDHEESQAKMHFFLTNLHEFRTNLCESHMRYVINVELLHWAVCSWLHTIYNHPFWFYVIILGFRCKQWVKLAGNKNLLSYKAQGLCTNAFLCSDHFSPEQFLSNDQLILNATPNLFKCIPLTENDVDKYFMKYLLFTRKFNKTAFSNWLY